MRLRPIQENSMPFFFFYLDNYADEAQQKVFDQMIAERKRIASKYRSEGDGRSAEIRGQNEKELKRIRF